jgi:hypothetical protein
LLLIFVLQSTLSCTVCLCMVFCVSLDLPVHARLFSFRLWHEAMNARSSRSQTFLKVQKRCVLQWV